MNIPQFLKETHLYSRLRDWRYLRRNRNRVEFYRQFIQAQDTIFDIGANTGQYTLIFKNIGWKVVSIEPQKELVSKLRSRFGNSSRIIVEHCGIGSSSGELTLHKTADLSEVASLRDDIDEKSRFAQDHPFTETETVPIQTLHTMIKRHGLPDFCKIDVEGFEDQVLSTLTDPIRVIGFEMNKEYFHVAEACIHKLTALAAYEFNFTDGEETRFSFTKWQSGDEIISQLSQSNNPLLWGDIYARLKA